MSEIKLRFEPLKKNSIVKTPNHISLLFFKKGEKNE